MAITMDWQTMVSDILETYAPSVDTTGWWPPPAAKEAPRQLPPGTQLHLRALDTQDPGALSGVFSEYWPAYRKWYFRVDNPLTSLARSEAALREHMPELVPVWQALVRELGGNDDEVARFLTEWNPPPLTSNCSQAVLDNGRLVRNYDYDPALFDAVVLRSSWLRPVIGTADQGWGLLDGMNDAGLVVSFTFGGRPDVGVGFGIPLVVRYILETCNTTNQAVAVLQRIPVHVAYNVTVTDAAGERVTVFVGPSRPVEVTPRRVTTNHQGNVDWPEHATRFLSVERLNTLQDAVSDDADIVNVMLRPPMRATRFADGFVTLYTAEYDNTALEVTYHWPQTQWKQELHGDLNAAVEVELGWEAVSVGSSS